MTRAEMKNNSLSPDCILGKDCESWRSLDGRCWGDEGLTNIYLTRVTESLAEFL